MIACVRLCICVCVSVCVSVGDSEPSSLPTYLSWNETPPLRKIHNLQHNDDGWGGGLGATAENHTKLSPQCLFLHFAL